MDMPQRSLIILASFLFINKMSKFNARKHENGIRQGSGRCRAQLTKSFSVELRPRWL